MTVLSDLRVLYHLARPARGQGHAERLEHFYAGQADAYDAFRRRLLKGREELFGAIGVPRDGIWVDLGGGTGANLENLGPEMGTLRRAYVVDLSKSLLGVARQRIAARGWSNVETVEADATCFRPPERLADVVTFSYSLTMIPDWFAAIENARAMLRPGGWLGVCDFYVSRKFSEAGLRKHGWACRTLWPAWFALDNVFLSPDHLPFLRDRFQTIRLEERTAPVPYLPFARVPHYVFLGQKR